MPSLKSLFRRKSTASDRPSTSTTTTGNYDPRIPPSPLPSPPVSRTPSLRAATSPPFPPAVSRSVPPPLPPPGSQERAAQLDLIAAHLPPALAVLAWRTEPTSAERALVHALATRALRDTDLTRTAGTDPELGPIVKTVLQRAVWLAHADDETIPAPTTSTSSKRWSSRSGGSSGSNGSTNALPAIQEHDRLRTPPPNDAGLPRILLKLLDRGGAGGGGGNASGCGSILAGGSSSIRRRGTSSAPASRRNSALLGMVTADPDPVENGEAADAEPDRAGVWPLAVAEIRDRMLVTLCSLGLVELTPAVALLTDADVIQGCCNQLTSLPPEIGRLQTLTVLNLARNQFTEFPLAVLHLRHLAELDISENQLETLPRAIGVLSSLLSLNLHANHLAHVPVTLARLTKLLFLDVSSNPLRALPSSIAALPSLRRINVEACPFWLPIVAGPELPPDRRHQFIDVPGLGPIPHNQAVLDDAHGIMPAAAAGVAPPQGMPLPPARHGAAATHEAIEARARAAPHAVLDLPPNVYTASRDDDDGPAQQWPAVLSLRELCARALVASRTVVDAHDLPSWVVPGYRACSHCGSAYFTVCARRFRVVGRAAQLGLQLVTLEDRLCVPHWDDEHGRVAAMFAGSARPRRDGFDEVGVAETADAIVRALVAARRAAEWRAANARVLDAAPPPQVVPRMRAFARRSLHSLARRAVRRFSAASSSASSFTAAVNVGMYAASQSSASDTGDDDEDDDEDVPPMAPGSGMPLPRGIQVVGTIPFLAAVYEAVAVRLAVAPRGELDGAMDVSAIVRAAAATREEWVPWIAEAAAMAGEAEEVGMAAAA
ncbi:hypothetical protein AMAG_08471 [Allomyces macrogynus ATCC 38327]|uniref:Uncharacterized protein n=1 Tax=Allomyces macrogynus (strain ATCC 38327) TaxID=578462 RepID=A0A0L0SL92_ALLM3|nr:hypothetical protein AMAG_08471 [Allomyces macrogynus ATCC 38327]|eukprot:KNE63331.1 hypothetical protein AMAG_08471 [Allomyces macrogynus ATCC 38327]